MDYQAFHVYERAYRILEKDLVELSEYVAISKSNYATFSDRLTIFFISVCSEVDSIADELCKELGADEKARFGINNKVEILLKEYKDVRNWICITRLPYEQIKLVPFANFKDSEAAEWWKNYNSVKHKRTDINEESGKPNFMLANLKNVLHAMAAFYLLLCRISKEGDVESKIFNIEKQL